MSRRVERGFERLREAYGRALQSALHHRRVFILAFAGVAVMSLSLVRSWGATSFPPSTPAKMRLHIRAPAATRIEDTQRLFGAVEERVRAIRSARRARHITDNIGTPSRHQSRARHSFDD